MIDITKGTCDMCIESNNFLDWDITKHTIYANGKEFELCDKHLLSLYKQTGERLKKKGIIK